MTAGSVIREVIKRDGAVVPYKRLRVTNAIYRAAVAAGGRDKERAENLANEVEAVLAKVYTPEHPPSVEHVQDVVERILIKSGHSKVAKAFILYRAQQHERRKVKLSKTTVHSGNIPYRKIWEVLAWAADHDLHHVDQMNERLDRGEFPDIVRESDLYYESDVKTAAELIAERAEDTRIVVVAGPSSSGKTTTTRKLSENLEKRGLGLVELNVDHYFFDLEAHPKDEFGDYDFETPQALDLPLINKHIKQLLEGRHILIPRYDFKEGKQYSEQIPMHLESNEIILIDSLHGLYGEMLDGVPDESIFRCYIETLLQMRGRNGKFLRWTDLRLMRRMVRDEAFRAYDLKKTLTHWHYVRSAELRHILPYIHTADYILNGAVPYELPVMRNRLFDHFKGWEQEFSENHLRMDAHIRARRVREMLETIHPVTDESPIPDTSHFREFIGGSKYDVHH